MLFDPESGRLLGAGIVGTHAGDLIAETTLAIEMGADGLCCKLDEGAGGPVGSGSGSGICAGQMVL